MMQAACLQDLLIMYVYSLSSGRLITSTNLFNSLFLI